MADKKIAPFVISRVFDAPRDRVWQAWTEVERLKQWFSPKGFTVIAAKMDFRVGGSYHYGMRTPNGQEMWGKWIFRDNATPEEIATFEGGREGMKGGWNGTMEQLVGYLEKK